MKAILLHRLPGIIQRRRLLRLRTAPRDLRAAVEAHLLAVIEQAEDESSYYTMFLEQLMRYGVIEHHPFGALPATYQASQKEYVERVGRMLGHLPPPLRADRINQASAICLHASADRERAYGGALGWVLLAQVGIGVLLAITAVVLALIAGPWWLALAAAPAAAALAWRRMAPLVLVLTYSLAAFGPLLVLQLAALVPFRVVEAVVELVTGGDPADVLRPTVSGPGGAQPGVEERPRG